MNIIDHIFGRDKVPYGPRLCVDLILPKFMFINGKSSHLLLSFCTQFQADRYPDNWCASFIVLGFGVRAEWFAKNYVPF